MAINLSGLILPVTTPFTADEEVDEAALTANIDRWNAAGITGYVVLGSTGERVNLDEREYLQVITAARNAVPASMTFIAGAGQQSTRTTLAEIERAARAGAEAALVITPHYYRAAISQAALIDHYTRVADASPVPIILYSMPDLTGITIEPETAARLSEHHNIIGLKDSSNDVAKLRETVAAVARDFAVTVGNGTVFCDALRAGAAGGILAVGCVVPELCLEIYRSVGDGHADHASNLQDKLAPLARAVTRTHGIGGLKMAIEMVGYAGGLVRRPLRMPTENARADIQQLLEQALSFPEMVTTGSLN